MPIFERKNHVPASLMPLPTYSCHLQLLASYQMLKRCLIWQKGRFCTQFRIKTKKKVEITAQP